MFVFVFCARRHTRAGVQCLAGYYRGSGGVCVPCGDPASASTRFGGSAVALIVIVVLLLSVSVYVRVARAAICWRLRCSLGSLLRV